jgi:hypothetical protein
MLTLNKGSYKDAGEPLFLVCFIFYSPWMVLSAYFHHAIYFVHRFGYTDWKEEVSSSEGVEPLMKSEWNQIGMRTTMPLQSWREPMSHANETRHRRLAWAHPRAQVDTIGQSTWPKKNTSLDQATPLQNNITIFTSQTSDEYSKMSLKVVPSRRAHDKSVFAARV